MSMGESTRRKLESVVRGAAAGGGGAAPAQYVGGWQGGLGGTWGKAGRGLGDSPGADNSAGTAARPGSAGRVRPGSAKPAGSPGVLGGPIHHPDAGTQKSSAGGMREKVRPASAGVKSVWDEVNRELPKAPPHALTSGKVRPRANTTASLAPYTMHSIECKVQGMSLEPASKQASGRAGAGGVSGSAAFGTPPAPGYTAPGSRSAGPSASNSILLKSRQEMAAMRDIYAQDGVSGVPTEAHLAALEDAIRDAVRVQRSVYEGSKEMLLKLFRAVDDGSGDVSIAEFISVCAQVGVEVSQVEAAALFRRAGYDNTMPYEKFAHNVITQPARQLAEDMPVHKGAFQAGSSAAFHGKVLYRHCRKPVYTPSDWDPRLADRSADLPMARLVLEFVYGYQGHDSTAQNLFYTSEGKVVYFTAGVGVVYQRPPIHHQYFYLGHTDDITSLALCRAAVQVDGLAYPERTLVATGQVTSTEEGPFISVWDSRGTAGPAGPTSAQELVRLKLDKDARGITALAFSPSGNRLAAVATDNQHTVYVYDWRKQRLLSSGKGQMGDPPQVYGVEWNPYDTAEAAFLTFGRKHIKCWNTDVSDPSAWTSKSLSFGRQPMQNVTSAQWLPPRSGGESLVVAGVADGNLYVFKGSACIKSVVAHRPGPQVIQADGQPSCHGVRGLRVCKNDKVLLSGGADGLVLQWDISDGNLMDARFAGSSMQLRSPFGAAEKHTPGIRSLDYSPELDRILVGTSHCDIQELTPTTMETLMDGHSGDVFSLAAHPQQPNIIATVSDSGHIHVWDLQLRQMLRCAPLSWTPRAVAFSAAPVASTSTYHLAVGSSKGHIKVLDADGNLKPLHMMRDSKEGVHDIKYAPNNRWLAVATYDTWIDLYNVSKEYSRVARCQGHSSTVRALDWSVDSSVLQTVSADLELLYWNARTGKQITMPQRDTQFQTWTVNLGFPVMGIFPPYADGTDVNSVDRSKDQQFVVTSDDEGLVKLFNYPCVVDDAPHRAYRGHSSHVMGVRFNADGSLVCSVGGHDWAIFQFKVVHIQPDAPPPEPPKPVWGALDPAGRAFGYTTTPASVSAAQGSAAPPLDESPLRGSPVQVSSSAQPDWAQPAGLGGSAGGLGTQPMAAIQEEASAVSLASQAVGREPPAAPGKYQTDISFDSVGQRQ